MSITRKVLIMLSFGLWFVSLTAAMFFFFTEQYNPSNVASLTSLIFFVIMWKGLFDTPKGY